MEDLFVDLFDSVSVLVGETFLGEDLVVDKLVDVALDPVPVVGAAGIMRLGVGAIQSVLQGLSE